MPVALALALALAPAGVLASPADGTVAEPEPPGWQVPPGERGAAPDAPIAAPPPVESEASDEDERPKIELESLDRDAEDPAD